MSKDTAAKPTLSARIAIWSPGTFTALSGAEYTFSAADLAATAEAYSPVIFRAPWVKGHPQADDPAQGWADALTFDGHILWASSSKIDPAFAEEVRMGRWGKISPRFFPPDHPQNPTPGKWYLRHIGWLGAAAPANKNLPHPEFAKTEDGLIAFAGPDIIFDPFGPSHTAGAAGPHATQEQTMPEQDKGAATQDANQDAQFAEREQQINAREAELAARETELAKQEQARRLGDCAAFAQKLIDDHHLVPRLTSKVTALLAAQPVSGDSVEFSEDDEIKKSPAADLLREVLADLVNPDNRVDFSERSKADGDPAKGASFSAPDEFDVDNTRLALHAKALQHQKAHKCDYVAALAAVSG